MAELFATLTCHAAWNLPGRACLQVLRSNLSHFQTVSLDQKDYWRAIERMVGLSLRGGGLYDALHAQAALKSGADQLLTLNSKHFLRLGEEVAGLVREP
jgi:predicted nucleic acid-binding protein